MVEVGGRLTGSVSYAGSPGTTTRAIVMMLRWRTGVKGSRDGATTWKDEVEVGPEGTTETSFVAPINATGPVSYAGKLILVRWELVVQVDKVLARDPSLALPITVVPEGGAGFYSEPHPLKVDPRNAVR